MLDLWRHCWLVKGSAVSVSLEIYRFLPAFYFSRYIFCDTVQSLLWECCFHCFHWGNSVTLWLEGECTACTFNRLEWKIAVFLWPRVQPLCIQGHGIIWPWVQAVEFCENEISSFMFNFFHYAPSVSLVLCFPPMGFLDSLVWLELLSLCTCVCVHFLIGFSVDTVFVSL